MATGATTCACHSRWTRARAQHFSSSSPRPPPRWCARSSRFHLAHCFYVYKSSGFATLSMSRHRIGARWRAVSPVVSRSTPPRWCRTLQAVDDVPRHFRRRRGTPPSHGRDRHGGSAGGGVPLVPATRAVGSCQGKHNGGICANQPH